MIEVTVLGTTAGPPTKERGHSAVALKYEGSVYLFDCGENTQRQVRIAGLSLLKVKAIFITHWHADHFAGLLGLLQSMVLLERKTPLSIYGPKPANEFMQLIFKLSRYKFASADELGFELKWKEIAQGLVFDSDKFNVSAFPSTHTMPAVSYKFEEKAKPGKFNVKKAKQLGLKPVQFGQLQRGSAVKVANKTIKPEDVMGPSRPGLKFVYTGDTGYNEKLADFAKEADLLLHEATYTSDLEEQAIKIGHSTSKQAAEIAKKAKVKKLLLTHISGRYKDTKQFLTEAKKVFKNTEIARDLMRIVLK